MTSAVVPTAVPVEVVHAPKSVPSTSLPASVLMLKVEPSLAITLKTLLISSMPATPVILITSFSTKVFVAVTTTGLVFVAVPIGPDSAGDLTIESIFAVTSSLVSSCRSVEGEEASSSIERASAKFVGTEIAGSPVAPARTTPSTCMLLRTFPIFGDADELV